MAFKSVKYKLFLVIFLILPVLLPITGCGNFLFFNKQTEEKISNLASNAVLLDMKEIRSMTISLLQKASRAIFIELSALDDAEIIDLLINKSKEGVEIRILLDQWQRENSPTINTLKNNNISVQYYPTEKGQYHRVRYLVTDYRSAIFYGTDWTSKGFNSHSMAIVLTGDTAWKITKAFDRDWLYTTTLSLELPAEVTLPEENITFSSASGNVKQQILRSLKAAQSEIKIITEQLSEPDTVEAIIEAKERGCDIKIILNPSCAVATPNTIKKFQEAGIDLRFFRHPADLALGMNLGIFDNSKLITTSSSWTYQAFVINHEASLTLSYPQAIPKINDLFEQEWNNSTAV